MDSTAIFFVIAEIAEVLSHRLQIGSLFDGSTFYHTSSNGAKSCGPVKVIWLPVFMQFQLHHGLYKEANFVLF